MLCAYKIQECPCSLFLIGSQLARPTAKSFLPATTTDTRRDTTGSLYHSVYGDNDDDDDDVAWTILIHNFFSPIQDYWPRRFLKRKQSRQLFVKNITRAIERCNWRNSKWFFTEYLLKFWHDLYFKMSWISFRKFVPINNEQTFLKFSYSIRKFQTNL